MAFDYKKEYKGSRGIDGYSEGLCVQCMHIGSYDEEPKTIERMNRYLAENGLENDYSGERFHHEIYLSDPRKVSPERCKTVIRQPVAPPRTNAC